MRAADGKASVSTNSWIQVLGRRGDRVMIQYSTGERYRIGWIDADVLPTSAQVDELVRYGDTATSDEPCALTDDPLYSYETLATVPAETPMRVWAYLGEECFAQTFALGEACLHCLVETVELVSDSGVERYHSRGAVGRRAYGAEFKAVAGEGEGRRAVAVGVVDEDFGNLRHAQRHGVLRREVGQLIVSGFLQHVEHVSQLAARED